MEFSFNRYWYYFLIIFLLGIIFGIFNYYWLINAHNPLDENWDLHVSDSARLIASFEERLKLGIQRERLFLSSFSELQINEKGDLESVSFDFNLGKEDTLEIIIGEGSEQHSIKLSNYGNIESGYFKVIEGKYYHQRLPFKLKFKTTRWNNLNLKILDKYLMLSINKKSYQLKRDEKVELSSIKIRSGPETIIIDNVIVKLKNGEIFQNRFESRFKKTNIALMSMFLSCIVLLAIWLTEFKILSKIHLLNKKILNLSFISYLPIMLLSLVFFFNVRNDILILIVFLLIMFLKSFFLIKHRKSFMLRDKNIYSVHLKLTQRIKSYSRYILSIDGFKYVFLLLIYATILFFYLQSKLLNDFEISIKLAGIWPGLKRAKDALPFFAYFVVPLSLVYSFILSILSNIKPKYIVPYNCFFLLPIVTIAALSFIFGNIPDFNNFFLLMFMIIIALFLHFLYMLINSVHFRHNKAVCFLLLIFIFAAVEISSRAANFNRLWRPKWKATKGTEVLAADDYLLWLPADIQVKPDGKIFFKGKEYSPKKPTDTLRIISLGDSTTWGQGIKKFEDTYPRILNTMLNQKESRRRFEVFNLSVPGYSSFQGLLFLKKYILKLSPDIITVRFFANDASDNLKIGTTLTDREYWMKLKSKKTKPNLFTFLQSTFPRCKIASDIKKIILNLETRFKLLKPKNRVPVNEYIHNLKEIARIAKENNIKIFFIYETLATGYLVEEMINNNPYFRALKLVSEEENIKLIDPITSFVERKHEALFFDEIHPTVLGHRIIAEQIFNTLKEEGTI